MRLQLRFSVYSMRGQRPRHRSCAVGVDQQTAASVQPPRRARVLDPQLADRRGCSRTSGVQHDARLRRFQPASTPASKSRDARCRPAVVSFRLYWPVLASYTLQPMSAGRELGHTTNAPRASGSEAGRTVIAICIAGNVCHEAGRGSACATFQPDHGTRERDLGGAGGVRQCNVGGPGGFATASPPS